MNDPLASRFPTFRGCRHRARAWAKIAGRLGFSPTCTVTMRIGHRMILDRRSGTERWAFYSGSYDDSVIRRIAALLPEGQAFLDIGANVGFFTLGVAWLCRNRSCRVHAFEPGPGNFGKLSANIALNQLSDRVTANSFGLSSAQGRAALTLREDYLEGSQSGNAAIEINDGDDDRWQKVGINLRALDEIWDGAPIGVIKLDIEGHEDEFFAGACHTLCRHRPIIYMEVNNHYYRRKQKSLEKAYQFLLGDGYAIYRDRKGESPEPVCGTDQFTGVENVWLIPEERRVNFDAIHASNPG
jgi:FkbM family methyltransferase